MPEASATEDIVTEWRNGHGHAATLREVWLGKHEAPILRQPPMDNTLREQMIQQFEQDKASVPSLKPLDRPPHIAV